MIGQFLDERVLFRCKLTCRDWQHWLIEISLVPTRIPLLFDVLKPAQKKIVQQKVFQHLLELDEDGTSPLTEESAMVFIKCCPKDPAVMAAFRAIFPLQ